MPKIRLMDGTTIDILYLVHTVEVMMTDMELACWQAVEMLDPKWVMATCFSEEAAEKLNLADRNRLDHFIRVNKHSITL